MWRRLAEVQTEHQNGEERDLSDFKSGMVDGARRAGLSISETPDVLGFTHTTISRVYREWIRKRENILWAAVVWTKMLGCISRRSHRVPLLSAKNKKLRLQFTQDHQHWTIEDCKNVAWSDESWFLLWYSDVESEFGVKNMKAWIHPALSQRFRLLVVV